MCFWFSNDGGSLPRSFIAELMWCKGSRCGAGSKMYVCVVNGRGSLPRSFYTFNVYILISIWYMMLLVGFVRALSLLFIHQRIESFGRIT